MRLNTLHFYGFMVMVLGMQTGQQPPTCEFATLAVHGPGS